MQVFAEDEGEPSLSSNVSVTVNVIRNKPPRFDPSILTLTIREDAGVLFRVGSMVAKEEDTVVFIIIHSVEFTDNYIVCIDVNVVFINNSVFRIISIAVLFMCVSESI